MSTGVRLGHPRSWDFDQVLFWSVIGLVVVGVVFIYSATVQNAQFAAPLHTRQLVWAAVGLAVLAAAAALPINFYYSTAYLLYALGLLLLVAVMLFGGGDGSTRWFDLGGGIRFQPSEPAKVATVIAAARYLSGRHVDFRRIRDLALPVLLVGVPFLLVARQPDLGTAAIFPALLIPMLFWAGMPVWGLFLLCSPVLSVVTAFSPWTWGPTLIAVGLVLWKSRLPRWVLVLVLVVNVVLGIVTPMVWEGLHEYQRQRILTFVDPQQDPLGAGYHVIQSTVAVGSGGLVGKGFLEGSQTKLNFLPEQHTDFIFSVIAEEMGLLGVLVVMVLFGIVLYRCVRAAAEVKNPFAGLVIVGTSGILFAHFVVNVGMALGLLPITGLPLPFITYGGSHLVSQLLMVGLVLGMRMRWMEY